MRYFTKSLKSGVCVLHFSLTLFRLAAAQELSSHRWSGTTKLNSTGRGYDFAHHCTNANRLMYLLPYLKHSRFFCTFFQMNFRMIFGGRGS